MAIPLLLDVDTGVDDAMAIALAASLTSHDLVAVTTVAGNVPLERSTDNSLRVLEWLGEDAPVYRGMSRPLVRTLHTATSVHGNDGLGGWGLPAPKQAVGPISAPEAIIRLAREHKGALDAAFVGPLTNLAVALMLEPDLAGWFNNVTIMGGAFFGPGNVTPAAEFNIYVDPEAANVVARSGLDATWIGLDVTHQTALSRGAWDRLNDETGKMSTLAREVSRQTFVERNREQVYLHDPLAVAVLTSADLVECIHGQVLVETGEDSRGETRIAHGDGTSLAAATVDSAAFLEMFGKMLSV